jgi:hypothetical protein
VTTAIETIIDFEFSAQPDSSYDQANNGSDNQYSFGHATNLLSERTWQDHGFPRKLMRATARSGLAPVF